MNALFDLGRIVATPDAIAAIVRNGHRPIEFITLHSRGKWGDLCPQDKEANNLALKDGSRILSAYRLRDGTKIWIITEAVNDNNQREVTTLLLPENY